MKSKTKSSKNDEIYKRADMNFKAFNPKKTPKKRTSSNPKKGK